MAEIYTGGGRPLRTRMDMCSDLLVLRKKINTAGDAQKINVGVMLGRRITAIRRVLLGRAGVSLADELLVPGAAAARLLAELEAVKDRPASERVARAAYARGIMQTIAVIQTAETKVGASDPVRGVWWDTARAINEIRVSVIGC